MSSVISVENLGKRYLLSHQAQGEGYRTLREALSLGALSLGRRLMGGAAPRHGDREEFWALKEVGFTVQHGDRVGIVGRNGAGKSTLLKILSRITEPTTGAVRIRGRVASLLEVGTGFHPELSGRENIFLNGAILGMSRVEIRRKFDAIVDFAEIEKFLDTPVKRYSSGMYVRLAFAVAAHLEPEILVVDEVLAVGDAQFQKKCLGKMEDVSAREGRTVLFVSHNMGTVRHLCNKGILLNQGQVEFAGSCADTVSRYEKGVYSVGEGVWDNAEKRCKGVYLERIVLLDQESQARAQFLNSETISVAMRLSATEATDNVKVGFDLIKDGVVAFRTEQLDSMAKKHLRPGENVTFTCQIPGRMLNVGEYFIRPLVSIHCVESLTVHDQPVLSFKIALDPGNSSFHAVLNENNHPGALFPLLDWKVT